MSAAEVLEFLTQSHPWVTVTLLFLAAMVEYVFPPFPGDTVTLAGAFLVTSHGYSFTAVFLSVLAGGMVGSAADYWIGVMVGRGGGGRVQRLGIVRKAMDGAVKASKAFERHGEAYIVINRFLPGVRAFLFVAAGMRRMRFKRVMFFAAISSAAWNLLIIGAGMALGATIGDMQSMLSNYYTFVWILILVVPAALAARYYLRRRRKSTADRDEHGAI